MTNTIRLSILDQSPVMPGKDARQALAHTLEMAQTAEQLGYHRFWMSEHHLESLAHSSPEIMIAHVAAHTSSIRVGSGGVMLPHYSAYKVAEQFRLLEALHPGRIDLGIGRAPGGMPIATKALQEYKATRGVDHYPQQMDDVIHYLNGSTVDEDHRFPGLKAMPEISTAPQIWVLGSSGGSAGLAASRGVNFAHAQFISGQNGAPAVRAYREHFAPSVMQDRPGSLVAFFVACAETDEEANQLASILDLGLLRIEQGQTNGFPSLEEALQAEYSPIEQRHIDHNRKRMLVGSPKTIKEKLNRLSEEYVTNEFMLAAMIPDMEQKIRCYELLAGECMP